MTLIEMVQDILSDLESDEVNSINDSTEALQVAQIVNSSIIEPVRSHHIKGMQDVPLWLIEMPKLYPLDEKNRKIVTTEIKNWIK